MAGEEKVTLARKMDRLFTEFGTLRDEVMVISTMVIRLDQTVDALKNEIRAVHAQNSRLDSRMRKIEDKVFGE
jgi:hypothetical protein